jgi:hypothetical protein
MAVIYRVDGTEAEVQPANGTTFTLAELQTIVGGFIEMVTLGFALDGSRIAFFIDEEGKLKGKLPNLAATALWASRFSPLPLDEMIVGDAILVTVQNEGTDEERSF